MKIWSRNGVKTTVNMINVDKNLPDTAENQADTTAKLQYITYVPLLGLHIPQSVQALQHKISN